MKKIVSLVLALLMVGCAFSAMAEDYSATVKGFGGDVTVTLSIENDTLTAVTAVGDSETAALGGEAMKKLTAEMVAANSIEVDGMTGASVTSAAVLEAAKQASAESGVTLVAVENAEGAKVAEDDVADIVVVGAGGAGMTAAIKATELGKKVILLEKMPIVGGNTAMGTTAFFAVESSTQKAMGIDATVQDMYEWLLSTGTDAYPMDPEASMVVAEKSAEAADWMISIGCDLGRAFNTYFLSPSDGSAPGVAIVSALKNKMDEIGVDYRLENKGCDIVLDENGQIAGVTVESPNGNYTISAKAVILTAGGFANNQEMLGQYDERWASLGCSSSKGQNGDGIKMGLAVGADVAWIDNIKVNPTVLYNGDNLLSMSTLRSNGGLLVNKLGKRFYNESGNYTLTSAALLEQPDAVAFMVFDATMLDIGLMATYNQSGYFVEADTIEGLAEKLGIDPEGLAAEVARNQEFCANGKDEDFGRTNLTIKFDNPPFYGVEVHPAAQGTFGGLKVNAASEVISVDGNVIPGLYAAGENAGEGTQGNAPLVGNVVFGTLAAEGAAAFVG